MKLVTNILSFVSMMFGFLVSALAKWTHIIDDSITTIAGLIGLAGAIVWLFIAITKLKREKIEIKISKIELKKLESNEAE